MADQIKNLIEKIQQEGIKAGQDKAQDITVQAERRGEEIITQAKKQAQKLIADAQAQVANIEKAGQASLQQSGRDLLLSLRKEINATLEGLILQDTRAALKTAQLSKIISMLIKQRAAKQEEKIIVALSAADLQKIKKAYFNGLSNTLKQGISLQPSGEISAGFRISYDNGKSHFDFTDKGIAEYLSAQLKPMLAEALTGAASSKSKK